MIALQPVIGCLRPQTLCRLPSAFFQMVVLIWPEFEKEAWWTCALAGDDLVYHFAGPWTGRGKVARPDLLRSILRLDSNSGRCLKTKLCGHVPCQWWDFIVSSCEILDERRQSCKLVTPEKCRTIPTLEEEMSLGKDSLALSWGKRKQCWQHYKAAFCAAVFLKNPVLQSKSSSIVIGASNNPRVLSKIITDTMGIMMRFLLLPSLFSCALTVVLPAEWVLIHKTTTRSRSKY